MRRKARGQRARHRCRLHRPRTRSGFDAFVASMHHFQWPDIEACSGLTRADIEAARSVYRNAKAVIACYGMGLTQHRSGVLAIQMLSNLLLMRGNIGKPGAGIFPVRGHSNVQGQRTVGITEKPDLVPLDRLAKQYGFDPPARARPQYCRSLRGRARRQRQGVHCARRQLHPRHSRNRHHGARLAATPS